MASRRPFHSVSGAQQIFLGDHLEDGADVLRHAAVDEHEALLQAARASSRETSSAVEDAVARQQAAAADAELRIAFAGRHAVDELDAGPDAAGILPAAARAAEPLAENRARGHEAAVVVLERRRSARRIWPVARMQTAIRQAEQIGGDRQARALRNIVHLADDLDAVAGLAGEPAQQLGERLRRAFHARAGRCRWRSRRPSAGRDNRARSRRPRRWW